LRVVTALIGAALAVTTTVTTTDALGETGGISGWEEFWIVLIASVAALALSEAARRLWQRLHAPKIEIECGNTESFRREMLGQAWHVAPGIGFPPQRVYVTRLRIRETNNEKAPKVCIQVVATDPPPAADDPGTLPATLRWTSDELSHDLTPGDRGHVRICELVTYANPEDNWVYGYIPGVEVGRKIRLDVQAFVDGKPNVRRSFLVDWPHDAVYPEVTQILGGDG